MPRNNNGFSLISVMIASGIVGFLALTTMRVNQLAVQVQGTTETNLEIVQFRHRLEQNLQSSPLCTSMLESFPNIHNSFNENYSFLVPPEIQLPVNNALRFQRVIGGVTHTRILAQQGIKFNTSPSISLTPTSIKLVRSLPNSLPEQGRIYLQISIDKLRRNAQNQVTFRPLGGSQKILNIPLEIRQQFGQPRVTCEFGSAYNLDMKCESQGEYVTGIDEAGEPICSPIDPNSLAGTDTATPLTDPAGGGPLTKTSTQERSEEAKCFSSAIPAGFSYLRKGFPKKKAKYSLQCANAPAFVKTTTDSEGNIQESTYEFSGLDPEREYETRVMSETWSHCPEGKVVSSIKMSRKGNMVMNCKNALFQAKDENKLSPDQVEALQSKLTELSQTRSRLYGQLTQYEMAIEMGRDPATIDQGDREKINREIQKISSDILSVQNEIKNGFTQYVTSKENKSIIVKRNTEADYKGCPPGYFLTGAIVAKKGESFNIKCSQLSVLRD